jgi:hypothetical protein
MSPHSSWADAEEASVHLQTIAGIARLGDETDHARATLAGLSLRTTYATHNWFAYQAQLTGLASTTAHYGEVCRRVGGGACATAELERANQLLRAEVGAQLRLGVKVIPTVGVTVGAQTRRLPAAPFGTGTLPAQWIWDATAAASLGVDYRLGRRWVVGAAAAATTAVWPSDPGFQSVELTLHLAAYSYPLW